MKKLLSFIILITFLLSFNGVTKDYKYYYNLGCKLQVQKKYADAIKNLNASIKLNKQYSLAYQHRADNYLMLLDFNNALKDFTLAYLINPKDTYSKNKATTLLSILSPKTQQVSNGSLTSNVIESQIDGEFTGWDGSTIFKLINGQIWQQAIYDYTYHYSYMPKITIYRDGAYYTMKVDGLEKTVHVKRIK